MKMLLGKCNVYYDEKYNIVKITKKREGHEESLEHDDIDYENLMVKINALGGPKICIKNLEKKD